MSQFDSVVGRRSPGGEPSLWVPCGSAISESGKRVLMLLRHSAEPITYSNLEMLIQEKIKRLLDQAVEDGCELADVFEGEAEMASAVALHSDAAALAANMLFTDSLSNLIGQASNCAAEMLTDEDSLSEYHDQTIWDLLSDLSD